MKVIITGSNGYIGKNLVYRLESEGFECIPAKRMWWSRQIEEISELLADSDIVINLAGAPILKRWTKRNTDEIYNSRILLTQKLVSAIHLLPSAKRPKIFITASAIGIYENGSLHDETSTQYDDGFLGKLVQDWEQVSLTLPGSVRRVVFRTGLVLGKESKTIANMVPLFKIGLGGRISKGKQPFPFIHIDDLVLAFVWAIKNQDASGVFNLVSPQSVTNKQFTTALAKQLRRPAFFIIPAFILRIIYGKASQLLVDSPKVTPVKLIKMGFVFQKPSIEDSLADIA